MKKLSLFLVALTMLLVSCKPEAEKPTVVTKSVGEVTETSAKVVGQVTADGGAEVTERGVCWSTDGTPTILDYRVKDVEGGLGSYDILFTDLVPNTQYYVRAYATNEAGTGYGDEKTFTTLGDEPETPEEPGDEPEEPGDGDGDENEDPETPVEPEEPGNEPEEPGDGDGDENEDPETPVDPEEPGDEPETPEQPEEIAPVVTTAEVTDIKLFSAVCGGEVVSNGEYVVVARGVCWSMEQNPTIEDNHTTDGISTGTYTSNLTELNHGTTYYVRAYAINAKGITVYGEEKSFMTLDKLLPVVTTTEVTGITCLTAVCGGEVTFDGNVAVTARGICWSTTQTPTIEDNKTNNGSGVGTYTYKMTNLELNTKYYVRAYATNEVGTSYGEEVSFTTLAAYSPATGSSNGYGYVDLGLSVKWATYNVGANAPEEYGDYFAWGETTTKETYYEDNCPTYGLSKSELQSQGYIDSECNLTSQYDAATANWGGTWRMPTYAELNELNTQCTWEWINTNGVKGYSVIGPNGNSIFLPAAGNRRGSSLNLAGSDGYYWCSTPLVGYDYLAYLLSFNSGHHSMNYYYDRYYGQSVRSVLE